VGTVQEKQERRYSRTGGTKARLCVIEKGEEKGGHLVTRGKLSSKWTVAGCPITKFWWLPRADGKER